MRTGSAEYENCNCSDLRQYGEYPFLNTDNMELDVQFHLNRQGWKRK
jgi:hypothetical protein